MTNTSTNDIAGPFSLNQMELQGTGPAGGMATINIDSASANSYLNFVGTGSGTGSNATAGFIDVFAKPGSAGSITYNINSNIYLSNDLFVDFNSQAASGKNIPALNLNGDISGPGRLVKGDQFTNGISTLTLTGTNTYTGGTVVGAGILQLGDGISNNGSIVGDITCSGGAPTLDKAIKIVFANPGNQTYSGVISGPCYLYKRGAGTLTLSGANTYRYAFGGSSPGITYIDAGTLALGSNDALPAGSHVGLNGGTLATEGFSPASSLGMLALTSSSIIDMCADSGSILRFADSHSLTWSGALTITNWDGSFNGGGADELFVGSSLGTLTASQLSEITFINPSGVMGAYPARILSTGEIVPIPEPATLNLLASGGLLFCVLVLRWWRKK
jgi:autotransporter-associated beta strand protein